MKMLNDEFNYFRGLFPLKVFITGPPCSGKTFFASQLSEQYGIPHLRIKDIIDYALSLDNDFGKQLKAKIEELKDQAEADYEKSRKKKDPDFMPKEGGSKKRKGGDGSDDEDDEYEFASSNTPASKNKMVLKTNDRGRIAKISFKRMSE